MNGIYITALHLDGDKATGFVLSIHNGRQIVRVFTRCTLATVIKNSGLGLDVDVFNVTATAPQNTP